MGFNLPQNCKIVEAITPQAGAAITADYISLKHARKVWIVVHVNQAHAATMAITVNNATDVAGTGAAAITSTMPIWVNQDCATSDTLVRQTDAVGFTTSAATTHKMVVIEVDPAKLSLANADCIAVLTAASNAANITSAMYYILDRYAQATPPSSIID